jgi:translation initiation factor 2 subunit 3
MAAINDPIAAASTSADVPSQEISVDVTKLTALSHEVISKQATVRSLRVRGKRV